MNFALYLIKFFLLSRWECVAFEEHWQRAGIGLQRSVKSVIRLPNTLRNGRSRYSVCYPKTAFMASSVAQRKPRSNGSPMKLRIIKITSRRISFQESSLRSFTLLSESWSINIYIDVFGRLSKLLFCLFSPPPHQKLTEKETRGEREIEVDELDKLIGIFFRQRLASPASPLHHGAENLPPLPPRLSARIMFCWFRVLFTSAEPAHRAKKIIIIIIRNISRAPATSLPSVFHLFSY